MGVELRRSSEFSRAELVAVFAAAYEGYFVPFTMDESKLAFMIEVFDLDLECSVVAVEGHRLIGLANLGRRLDRAWLGGVGVIPAERGAGVGELLTRRLLDSARRAGAREMVLEVIVENVPAISLYEKLGFARTRELEVLSVAGDTRGTAAREADVGDALRRIAATRAAPEPWQRDEKTVANLTGRPPAPQAMAAGGGVAIFREEEGSVDLLQAAGEPAALEHLVAAMRAKGKTRALNFPADGAVAVALRKAGAEVVARQYEMIVSL